MKLYKLPANNCDSLFGNKTDPKEIKHIDDVVIIAQKPDCSSLLVLSKTPYTQFEQFDSYDGFDFTYCQAWGLTVNEEVVIKTISDLRKNAYPPMADYLDAIVKNDTAELQVYIDKCLAVKAKYTKLENK